MSTRFENLVQHRPHAARRIVTAGNLAACVIPAAAVLAIVTDHTTLAVVCVLAGVTSYIAGYFAALRRAGGRLRARIAAALRDPLTGLPTRAAADEALHAATGTGLDVSVALADVDRLKIINDCLGYAAGDRYIAAVGRRLAAALPAGGSLYRQGGDEFLMVVPGADPSTLAAAIWTAMIEPVVIAGQRLRPRASVGIAASGGGDATYARACADAALASAKDEGGARALVYRRDRDGRPAADGTRTMRHRRDVSPRGVDALAWLPEPGDELVPVLWTVAQAHTVHEVLRQARDRWAQIGDEAHAAASHREPPATAGQTDVSPTSDGLRRIADLAAAEQATYTRLVAQLARLLDAFPDPGGVHHLDVTAEVVLVGVSSAFTAVEIEGLVRTAAEAVCGDIDELSTRQRDLAARAYTRLMDDGDD